MRSAAFLFALLALTGCGTQVVKDGDDEPAVRGEPDNDNVSPQDCADDADCDDGVFCNGEEVCGLDGFCQSGTPCEFADCQDCVCHEEDRLCMQSCEADAECDDGDFCNGREICADGGCVAGDPPCTDNQTCDGEAAGMMSGAAAAAVV